MGAYGNMIGTHGIQAPCPKDELIATIFGPNEYSFYLLNLHIPLLCSYVQALTPLARQQKKRNLDGKSIIQVESA
jgi:hypothetical protein